MRSPFIPAIALLLAALLAGCGFQMRGTADLPFHTLYMPPVSGGIGLDVKRNIQAGTNTKLVDDPKMADAQLQITTEARGRNILSLAATGRVREYQLQYTVGFRVHDGKGGEFVPANSITLTRDITFNDSDVLSKEAEEGQLYRDMQFDMVQQIMRRLAAAKPARPAVQ